MKAIILNSGMGKRMYPLTKNKPKCLIKINGNTILGHEIENLLHFGIRDIIITTGPFGIKIKNFIKSKFRHLNVKYVKNNNYKSTNAIYSLWLTRNITDDNIILMHGDMVFERKLLGKLLDKKYHNCVLVNNKIKPPIKDFKGEIKNNLIKKISVDIFGKNAFFMAPIYKFSKYDFNLWLKEIKKFVKNEKVNVYAEEALNNLFNKIKLHPIYFGDEFCMEVDDLEDLEVAKKLFSKNKM